MADSADEAAQVNVPATWAVPAGPAPMVSHFVLTVAADADGGPGEILTYLGYVAPPLGPISPNQTVPVATVATFALTRHRAEQLRDYLTTQINNWDEQDAATRGKREAKP
jgi:hypothetical protein